MDLDRLMIEWHEQNFEGYLFDTPADKIRADIKEKAQKHHHRYRLVNFSGIALAVIVAAAAAMAIYLEQSLFVRMATLFLMAVNFFELLWVLKRRAEEYKKPFYLPVKRTLIEERERIKKRIRATRWQLIYTGIASLGGLIYIVLDVSASEVILDFLVGFSVPFLIIHFTAILEAMMDLPRHLEKIERDIGALSEAPTSPSLDIL
jgi:small-conductance mechanosensitive channel